MPSHCNNPCNPKTLHLDKGMISYVARLSRTEALWIQQRYASLQLVSTRSRGDFWGVQHGTPMVQHAEFATCLAPKGQPVNPSFTWHNQMIQMTIGFFNTSCFEAYQSIARGRCHVRESIYMDQARFYDLDVGTGGPCYISLKSQWLNAAASNVVEASRSYMESMRIFVCFWFGSIFHAAFPFKK